MNDPTFWTYEAKKINTNEYQLIFNLKLDKGFHIWALKPGGDGFQIVPSFNFPTIKSIKYVGDIKELGKKITENLESVEGSVSFYSNEVQYIQLIKANPGTIVRGTHQYQVCNDRMCFPPTDKDFIFTLE